MWKCYINLFINYGECIINKSYLSSRQQVKVGNKLSTTFIATSGVLQGSNFGPLLFAIFINNLSSDIRKSECLLFADFKILKNISYYEDCEKLQNYLDSVTKWLLPIYGYTIGNAVLNRCNQCEDSTSTYSKI